MSTQPPWLAAFFKRIFYSSQGTLEFLQILAKNNDIVRLPVFKSNYLINHPDAIHHILLTHRDNYSKADTSYKRVENVVGKGLLTTSGEEWAQRRQQYQPNFHAKSLENHLPIIQKYIEQMINQWRYQGAKTINFSEQMLALILNIAAEMLLGINVSEKSTDLVHLIHILNIHASTSINLWKWLPTLGNLRFQIAHRKIDKYLLASLNLDEHTAPPLLDHLFKKENGQYVVPKQDFLGEIKNFFVAGHETTGNAIVWSLYCLLKHPYVLDQVNNEISAVLKGDVPNIDNIEKLPALEMAIEESLRLYPPIWIFSRKALAEDEILGYKIPKNAIVNISPYLMHRHPKYWHQPDIFYPERFAQAVTASRPKCTYLPFGFGPRVCIGRQFAMMNIKLILVTLLQQFDFKLMPKNQLLQPLPLITLKPNKAVWVKINQK